MLANEAHQIPAMGVIERHEAAVVIAISPLKNSVFIPQFMGFRFKITPNRSRIELGWLRLESEPEGARSERDFKTFDLSHCELHQLSPKPKRKAAKASWKPVTQAKNAVKAI